MRYTLFSLDDRRDKYKVNIMRTLHGWSPAMTKIVNGSHRPSLEEAMTYHGYDINWKAEQPPKVGQLGIWYTVLNSFQHAPHVTFEDDAILCHNFKMNFDIRKRQLPEDTDFFSLFIPRDSDHLYDESMSVSSLLTRPYQRYGGVSMYYTEAGVEKIRYLLRRDGITDQYDNTLYSYAKAGELNGYCSKPTIPDLVYISGNEDSIVQESETYIG